MANPFNVNSGGFAGFLGQVGNGFGSFLGSINDGFNQGQWEREDNAYQRAVADAQKAGLSPLSVTGGASANSMNAGVNSVGDALSGIGLGAIKGSKATALGVAQLFRQIRRDKVDIAKTEADIEKTVAEADVAREMAKKVATEGVNLSKYPANTGINNALGRPVNDLYNAFLYELTDPNGWYSLIANQVPDSPFQRFYLANVKKDMNARNEILKANGTYNHFAETKSSYDNLSPQDKAKANALMLEGIEREMAHNVEAQAQRDADLKKEIDMASLSTHKGNIAPKTNSKKRGKW